MDSIFRTKCTTAIVNASELVAELTAMNRLHQLSTRLLRETELQALLEEVLNATIALQSADFGNVQLYNPRTQTLEIVAQRGFGQDFLDHFSSVNESGAACGRALKRAERVIIEDVLTKEFSKSTTNYAASWDMSGASCCKRLGQR